MARRRKSHIIGREVSRYAVDRWLLALALALGSWLWPLAPGSWFLGNMLTASADRLRNTCQTSAKPAICCTYTHGGGGRCLRERGTSDRDNPARGGLGWVMGYLRGSRGVRGAGRGPGTATEIAAETAT